MASPNYPNNPNVGDTHVVNSIVFRWDGEKWKSIAPANHENRIVSLETKTIDLETKKRFYEDTLEEVVNNTNRVYKIGETVEIGDRGNGIFTAIATGTTEGVDLPNTFNIIIGVANPLISFVLRIGDTVEVLQFGITEAASDAAIAYAEGVILRNVHFAAGTYSRTLKLNITKPIKVFGDGRRNTIIESTAADFVINADLGDPNLGSAGYYSFSLSEIYLKGSGFDGGTQRALFLRGAAYGSEVHNIRTSDTSVFGITLDNCWTTRIDNCLLWNQDPTDAATGASTASGIEVIIGHKVSIENTKINLFGGAGVGIAITGGDIPSITGCSIENVGTLITVDASDAPSITDNYFEQRNWGGGHDYALAADSRDQIAIGKTTICYNVNIDTNHFTVGNNRRIFSLYNANGGKIVNNVSNLDAANPCHFYIPNPASVTNIEVNNNKRIFIEQAYTEARLDDYQTSVVSTDRQTLEIPLANFVSKTGAPVLASHHGTIAWEFSPSGLDEITCVIPWPSEWGAGGDVHVNVELTASAQDAGAGNIVIAAGAIPFDSEGTDLPEFAVYYDTVKSAPNILGSFVKIREKYYVVGDLRWTHPVADSKKLLAVLVRRNGANGNDTKTGDLYISSIRLVREPGNYEWT